MNENTPGEQETGRGWQAQQWGDALQSWSLQVQHEMEVLAHGLFQLTNASSHCSLCYLFFCNFTHPACMHL
jgi:hypothetical protein